MKSKLKISKTAKIVGIVVAVVAVIVSVIAIILRPYPAEQEYLDMVYSNENILVTELDGWYAVEPANANANANSKEAMIFYPGGLVSADAYLYMLSQIAEETNQNVYVAKFPLSLGVLEINAAADIIEAYPDVEVWNISGHSLGGSMACRFVLDSEVDFENLILMASYCDKSIADKDVDVLTLYGTLNNGISEDRIIEFEENLPSNATSVLIQGMNHAQFGNYGPQRGDNVAEIEDDEATDIVVDEVVGVLGR